MKLLNFDLAAPNYTVELRAFGLNWDLHNFADFAGLLLRPDASATAMWVVPDAPNPWGDTDNHYGGCELRFREVRRLSITGRDFRMPPSEDRTLAQIARLAKPIAQNQSLGEGAEKQFGLLLTFQGGMAIEVDAAEAELTPIPRGDRRLTTSSGSHGFG
jgi:hypothetical protein